MIRRPPRSTLFPSRRSSDLSSTLDAMVFRFIPEGLQPLYKAPKDLSELPVGEYGPHAREARDRKSTRLNSSHPSISYAVFCLKKKNNQVLISPPDSHGAHLH